MQTIFLLLVITGILLAIYVVYAAIMAIYATYIGRTRPIYHGKFSNGKEVLDGAIDCNFKENFKEFFLP